MSNSVGDIKIAITWLVFVIYIIARKKPEKIEVTFYRKVKVK